MHKLPDQFGKAAATDMPRGGAYTLSDIVKTTVVIVCGKCSRRGVYNTDRLRERFGDIPLPTLISTLSADCPGRRDVTPRCAAVFEDRLDDTVCG